MPRYIENEFLSQHEHVFSLVKEHVDTLEASQLLNERVLPAVRLYAYNFFKIHQNPKPEDLQAFREHCFEINTLEEQQAAAHNPLCTVGIELEALYPPASRSILRKLAIPLIQEDDPTNKLWEVMLPWSYSTDTQVSMLGELVKMEAIKPIPSMEMDLKSKKRRRMALHINYGMPEDMQDFDFEDPNIKRMLYEASDALVLGYTSGKRILEHPGPTLSFTKEAERSAKTSMGLPNLTFRIELRALEFTEPLTYSLLYNSQRLMTAFFGWVRSQIPLPLDISPVEKDFAALYANFIGQFTVIRETYAIPLNFAQGDAQKKEYAAELVDNPEMQQVARQLINELANKVNQLIVIE